MLTDGESIVIVPLLLEVTVVPPDPVNVIASPAVDPSATVNLVLPFVVYAFAAVPVPAYRWVV